MVIREGNPYLLGGGPEEAWTVPLSLSTSSLAYLEGSDPCWDCLADVLSLSPPSLSFVDHGAQAQLFRPQACPSHSSFLKLT